MCLWLYFTFQYVSINTSFNVGDLVPFYSLHSNMFLLIPQTGSGATASGANFTFQYVSINTLLRGHFGVISPDFTFQYVSINTLLLLLSLQAVSPFTFQYVSINTSNWSDVTEMLVTFTFQYVSINTSRLPINAYNLILYIPICFY